jgi:2-polyprenyl-3-methyl-5-hydroxy-6-metoxy-1,4-benzoquinol methylase
VIFASIIAPLRPGRIVDLGAGHGEFSLIARNLGWEVTAVDARTTRMPTGEEGINWVKADVREFPVEGYNCIAMLGLLYHLELDDQLALLRRCAGILTIVDTRVSRQPTHRERGYDGQTFVERLEEPTASWGNRTSFWPTEESLTRMLAHSGYQTILKQATPYEEDRLFWVCG